MERRQNHGRWRRRGEEVGNEFGGTAEMVSRFVVCGRVGCGRWGCVNGGFGSEAVFVRVGVVEVVKKRRWKAL